MIRVKRRYVLFEIMPNNERLNTRLDITEKDVIEAIRATIGSLYGDYGLGCVMQSLRLNDMTRTGLLAVKRCHHTIVLTSLSFVKRIQHLDCILRTIHMSGTIRGCLKALRIHHNKEIIKCRQQLDSQSCRQKMTSLSKAYKDIESSLIGQNH